MKAVTNMCLAWILLALAGCGNSGTGEQAQVERVGAEIPQGPEACTLVMGYDPWEPYQYDIAGGHVFGLDVDLMNLVSRHAGCSLTFRRGTWQELLKLIQDGDIDLLAGATPTAERGQFAWFTKPYRTEEFTFFVSVSRSPEFEGKSLEELLESGKRIGVIGSYLYGEAVSALQDDPRFMNQFVYASIAEINIERLLDGAVDGVIEDKYVGASIIRHRSLQDFIMPHAMSFGSTGVSIMLSRATVDSDLFARIEDSVKELKDNGSIDKILVQYQSP